MPDAARRGTMKIDRSALRRDAKALRDALSEGFRAEASEAVCRNIAALPEYASARTVFAYYPMGSELDPRPLLEKALCEGKTVALPKVMGRERMAFYPVTSWDSLLPGPFGLREPESGGDEILPQTGDLILVPCLLFSREGQRVGYGGGYYDRWLAAHGEGAAMIVAFSAQEAAITPEAHDVALRRIATEKGVFSSQGGQR